MKIRLISLFCVAALLISLCACGSAKKENTTDPTAAVPEEAEADTAGGEIAEPVTADVGSWTWTKGELDCYGYSTQGVDCYMSFEYPENFKTGEENDSGLQYRGYYFNPADPDANANSSPYGLYIYFNQGAFGANRATLEADIEGGFTEREIGGRTVLFGEVGQDENNGAYVFSYYTSYSDDEYARIWFMVCDPEPDGAFRQAFEQSISFSK